MKICQKSRRRSLAPASAYRTFLCGRCRFPDCECKGRPFFLSNQILQQVFLQEFFHTSRNSHVHKEIKLQEFFSPQNAIRASTRQGPSRSSCRASPKDTGETPGTPKKEKDKDCRFLPQNTRMPSTKHADAFFKTCGHILRLKPLVVQLKPLAGQT